MTATDARETRAGGISEEAEVAGLKKVLQNVLGEKYYNLTLVDDGAQSYIFKSNWGAPDGQERSIKVDRTSLKSPRARRCAEKGCGTLRHAKTLASLPAAGAHNIIPLLDYHDLTGEQGVAISVHPQLEGPTLKKRIEENGPFKRAHDVRDVFVSVCDAVEYFTGRGFFHRDLNPFNIKVRARGKELGAWVLDFCNAGNHDALEPTMTHTAGNSGFLDPSLVPKFGNGARTYGLENELYAIGGNLHYALTGKIPFEIRPEEGIFRDAETGESLLDAEGKVDKKKFRETLNRGLSKVSWKLKRFVPVVRKLLEPEERFRYHSVEDVVKDLNKAGKTLTDRVRENWKVGAAAGVLGIASTLGLGYELYDTHIKNQRNLEAAVKEAEKYEVVAGWNGMTQTIENNLFNLGVEVLNREHYTPLYTEKDKKPFIRVEPGQKLVIYPLPKERPRPNDRHLMMPAIPGKIYVEGFPGAKEFDVYTVSQDPSYPEEGGMPRDVEFSIPELPEGIHYLVVEMYSHDKPDSPNNITALRDIKYKEPGKAIARKRIPIVVGNPKNLVGLNRICITGIEDSFSFGILGKEAWVDNYNNMPGEVVYEVSVPELGYKRIYDGGGRGHHSNGFSSSLWIPKIEDTQQRILQFVIRDKEAGRVLSCDFFPIRGRYLTNEGPIWLDWDFPGKDFSDKVEKLRKNIKDGKIAPELYQGQSRGSDFQKRMYQSPPKTSQGFAAKRVTGMQFYG